MLLSAHNLSYTRGERQLFNGLNFEVRCSEVLHITGPNGCGKTSLLRLLAGLLLPDSGEILWQQQPLKQANDFYKACYFIGHKTAVKNQLTVLENLTLQGHAFNGRMLTKNQLSQVLQTFKLNPLQHLLGQSLSAGQRQRVALTRLLMVNATLWLLDEPFTALDSAGIARLHQLMQAHINQGGMVVLSSHQPLNTQDFSVKLLELGQPFQVVRAAQGR